MIRARCITTILAALAMDLVTATEADEARVRRARNDFEIFSRANFELREAEHFLFSLKEPVRPHMLDEFKLKYEMQMRSIFFCTRDGVLAVLVKPTESIVGRVDAVDLHQEIQAPLRRHLSPDELGSDLLPGDRKLCGFEAKMSADNVKSFSSDCQNIVMSIEIENIKRRRFPVNHHKSGRDSKAI